MTLHLDFKVMCNQTYRPPALNELCAQQTHDLFATAKFLFISFFVRKIFLPTYSSGR